MMEVLDDKYQIEELLGQGGMGAVYRATHLGTKRTVAVKVIHPQLSTHDQFVARFRREAEAAGRLRHPNVVDVTDFGFAQTARGRVAYLAVTTDLTLELHNDFSPKQFSFNFSMSGVSGLYQLLNVFVTPLRTIMASLLYVKTRKAGGESLRDTN